MAQALRDLPIGSSNLGAIVESTRLHYIVGTISNVEARQF